MPRYSFDGCQFYEVELLTNSLHRMLVPATCSIPRLKLTAPNARAHHRFDFRFEFMSETLIHYFGFDGT